MGYSGGMLRAVSRVRETLCLVLLALLPFHALLVTVGTRALLGPDHAPMGFLAAWKEGVLALVFFLAFLEWAASRDRWRLDAIDAAALLFLFLAGVWFAAQPGARAVYGLKYDALPIIVLLVLRRVRWSECFVQRATWVVLAAGLVTALYGGLTLVLPMSVFRTLGYGDLHSLYVASGPLPPFHDIGSTALRRMQAGFSGPNQMGLWLLLPWSMAWLLLLRRTHRMWAFGVMILTGVAIAASLSRAAWIGAFVALLLCIHASTTGEVRRRLLGSIVASAAMIAFAGITLAPAVVVRMASSADHWRRPLEAIAILHASPLGTGLGSAGPASNRFSDTCVHLPADADASWAEPHPELCVFVGAEQVQPIGKSCACPFLPENWYLQLGVELGLPGVLLFVVLLALMLTFLFKSRLPLSQGVFAAFSGVCIAGLVLHAWEDAAVALTLWLLSAVCLPVRHIEKTA